MCPLNAGGVRIIRVLIAGKLEAGSDQNQAIQLASTWLLLKAPDRMQMDKKNRIQSSNQVLPQTWKCSGCHELLL